MDWVHMNPHAPPGDATGITHDSPVIYVYNTMTVDYSVVMH